MALGFLKKVVGLQDIQDTLDSLKEEMMAKFEDVESLVAAMNDATNAVAAKIDALAAQIAAGGMTSDQEAQVVTELQALRDRLIALGADPSNPV